MPKAGCGRKFRRMELYVLRHGIAEDRQTWKGARDSERPLTLKGLERLHQIVDAMEALELEFERVLSSPFRRARQTAELVSDRLKLGAHLEFTPHLAIPPSSARLIEQINALRPLPASVLLVGHEPHLSELISLLVTGGPGLGLTLRKGGLAKLEVEGLQAARCGTLEWLLTPRQMRLMR